MNYYVFAENFNIVVLVSVGLFTAWSFYKTVKRAGGYKSFFKEIMSFRFKDL